MMFSRKGVVGSTIAALPVIVITLVVLAVFVLLVGFVLTLKPAETMSTANRTSFSDSNAADSRILSEVMIHDSFSFKTDYDFSEIELYFPREQKEAFFESPSFEFEDGLRFVAKTYTRARGEIPYGALVALFTPIEQVMADRFGCGGSTVIKVFVPQHSGLGSVPGMMLLYDYPARQWSKGGEGLPKLESYGSSESSDQFFESYRSEGYYVHTLGEGAYLVVKGGLLC